MNGGHNYLSLHFVVRGTVYEDMSFRAVESIFLCTEMRTKASYSRSTVGETGASLPPIASQRKGAHLDTTRELRSNLVWHPDFTSFCQVRDVKGRHVF